MNNRTAYRNFARRVAKLFKELAARPPASPDITAAVIEASRLIAGRGIGDPLAAAAVISTCELIEPGRCMKLMKQCGIKTPASTHHTADGVMLATPEAMAGALGVELADVKALAHDLESAGAQVRHVPAGMVQ